MHEGWKYLAIFEVTTTLIIQCLEQINNVGNLGLKILAKLGFCKELFFEMKRIVENGIEQP